MKTRALEDRWLLRYFALLIAGVLALGGALLRGYVCHTLEGDAKVQTAFLDLSLRDRSRYLAEILRTEREKGTWPLELENILTRNHAELNRDIFIQVFEPDGRLIAASANTPPFIPLTPKAPQDMQGPPGWIIDEIDGPDDRRWRLAAFPVYTLEPEFRTLGFATAGVQLPDAARALRRFTWVLIPSLLGVGFLLVIALRAASLTVSQRLRREMESLHTTQQRFVADAAHELGTPLAVLRGEMEIALRRERTAADYRAALESCREEIERLSRLSENLLALATADAGHALVHSAPCDAAEIARTVHGRFAPIACEKQVSFTLTAPGTLPWSADAVAIEQILGNLVTNALRHTPAGGSVALGVEKKSDATVFEIADTGEGIPSAHLPLLFARFHRVDKARTRSAGGAGLGLAIVKTLVEAHGGSVAVESQLNCGARFTCRFPTS